MNSLERIYVLSKYVDRKSSTTFVPIRIISTESYKLITKNEKILAELLSIKSLFIIANNNLKLLLNEISHTIEKTEFRNEIFLVNPEITKIELNRHMLNFLSSMRSYLDHSETFLKRQFGDKSKEYKEYKLLTSSLYDNNFHYRFIYKLRNYAQHCGVPINSFRTTANITNNIVKTEVIIEFNIKEFLNNFDGWGATLKKNLLSFSTIPVYPLLELFETDFNKIGTLLNELILKIILPIKSLISTFNHNSSNIENLCITFYDNDKELLIFDSVFRYINQIEIIS
ncbi:hypothetical protein [Spirosoma litoris]